MDGHDFYCGFPNEPCSCGLSPEYRKALHFTLKYNNISREDHDRLIIKYSK
jgi:hypothetical protein